MRRLFERGCIDLDIHIDATVELAKQFTADVVIGAHFPRKKMCVCAEGQRIDFVLLSTQGRLGT